MSISYANVRSAIAQQVSTVTGMKIVPFPGQYFGRIQNSLAHLGFSVSIDSSDAMEDRQRATAPIYNRTNAVLTFAYRIRPQDVITDLDAATDKEEAIIKKCIGSYASIRPGLEVRYSRSTRTIPDSIEYIIIRIDLLAYHHI